MLSAVGRRYVECMKARPGKSALMIDQRAELQAKLKLNQILMERFERVLGRKTLNSADRERLTTATGHCRKAARRLERRLSELDQAGK